MNTEQERAELLPCPFCGGTNIEIQISTPDREGVPTNLMCSDCGASGPWEYEQGNSHAKADDAWNRRADLQSHKPNVEFEDPRVQLVYGIICGGHEPPEGEHWDGYVSRLIVEALQSQDREDAERYRKLRAMATQQADSLGPIFRIDVRRSAPYLFNFDAAIDHACRVEDRS